MSLERQIAGIRYGDHLCLICDTPEEQAAAVVPFISEGLRQGDRCVYVGEDRTADQISGALGRAGIDVFRETERGALQLLTRHQAPLAPGDPSPEAMIQTLRQMEARALEDGFEGFRFAGQMTCALGPDTDGHRLLEFEARLNRVLAGSRSLALCQYDRHSFPAATIERVLEAHPVAVIGEHVIPNLYFGPEGSPLSDEEETRVAWKIEQLKRSHLERERLRSSEEQLHAALERERALRVAAERAADRIGRLQTLTAALSEAATPKQVADAVLLQGMLALGAIAGGVCLITPDGQSQRLISVFGPGVDPDQLESWSTFPLDAPYPVNDSARRMELISMRSIDEFWERYPAIAQHIHTAGYQAYLAAPLQVDGRPAGCINYNFAEQRDFTDEDHEFFLVLARQASLALERAWLFEAEHDARHRAEHANQVKSQFLALMSHELRTPLNAILGYADLLAAEVMGRMTSGQRAQVERIKVGAYHLMDVIDEILTFSRLEAGREEVRLVDCDLGDLARETVSMLAMQASDKGIALSLHLDAPETRLRTDPSKLRQILLNLVGNAVKFTSAGKVELRIARSDGTWVLQVRDTGPGIGSDQLERIFEPFTQVDGSSTRTQGGTGLGLTVSRRLAQLLGGDITVESTPGVGSTFTVCMPAVPLLVTPPV